MVFGSPAWVPDLEIEPPDSITIAEFLANERYGRRALAASRNPYTCGLSGRTFSAAEVCARTDFIARALARRLDLEPNTGTEWDKVVAVFSRNTIDYIPVTHAVHRLAGIVTPASSAYNAADLSLQLRSSRARALFTCVPLLSTAIIAASDTGIPPERVFLLDMPGDPISSNLPFATVSMLVAEGMALPELEPLRWARGQGALQTAYLNYSSGTSGLPKAAKVSHFNMIANILQYTTYGSVGRKQFGIETQTSLGLLPFSHIYGLVIITHTVAYRGDEVIVLPKYNLKTYLAAIQRFKIEALFVVPPVLIQMIRNNALCRQYDLGSVRTVRTGAAPLGAETVQEVSNLYPSWCIGQGYGMTETAACVSTTSDTDIFFGSAGSFLPRVRAKIMGDDGKEVTALNVSGELLVQSPSVVLGYLNNEQANAETFVWDDDGRWIRTGDQVQVRRSPQGHEHLFILDRIKELIKVNGHQVAPAELEAHLLAHPAVQDCAVIQVPDDVAGELPRAYIVKSLATQDRGDDTVAREICQHVQAHKPRYKWLGGGVVFVNAIPKSPSGKTLRRLLRDRASVERSVELREESKTKAKL